MKKLEAQNALVCGHDSWLASKYQRQTGKQAEAPSVHNFIQRTRTKYMTQQGTLPHTHARDRDLKHTTLHSNDICVAKRAKNSSTPEMGRLSGDVMTKHFSASFYTNVQFDDKT